MILSQLNSMEMNLSQFIDIHLDIFQRKYGDHVRYITDKLAIPNTLFYSEQGLFTVWKWLLAYGDLEKINQVCDINDGVYSILHINLMVSDSLINKDDINNITYELFTNLAFNSRSDNKLALARAGLIYDEIASNRDNFRKSDFIDLNAIFFEKYNCSIKEFMAILFGIMAGYTKRDNTLKQGNAHGEKYYSQFANSENVEMVLSDLSMTLQEAKEWAVINIDRPWDFSKFRQKPLIKLENGSYFPISLRYLEEQIFDEFFFKIRHCFPTRDTTANSFIGLCLEKYVTNVTNLMREKSNIPYQIIEEFEYGNNRSPDVLIKLGNNLLAVESKARRLKMDSIMTNNPDSIDYDLNRMFKQPITQLHDRLKELKNIGHSSISDVENIYLMSVTLGDIPTLAYFENKIIDDLYNEFELPIKSVYHLSIEEYEILMNVIGRKNSRPLFRILDNKTSLYPNEGFKNFIIKSHYSNKRLNYFTDKISEYCDQYAFILMKEKWLEQLD